MSFLQILKLKTDSKKDDNILKNNDSLYKDAFRYQNYNPILISNITPGFNFSNIRIFGTDERIQSKRSCNCGGTCPRCNNEKDTRGILHFQPKLKVRKQDDHLEREADTIAEQIVGLNYNKDTKFGNINHENKIINRKHFKNEKESYDKKEKPLQTVQEGLSSPGHPLDLRTLAYMESKFGHKFSDVRIHADGKAMQSAEAINARAYTVGNDIIIGDSQFSPTSTEGQKLLAHELVHVLQQNDNATTIQRQPNKNHDKEPDSDDEEEEEEETMVKGPKPISLGSLVDPSHMCGGGKCMTDEEIYGPSNESIRRFDALAAKEMKIGKVSFDKRFKKVMDDLQNAHTGGLDEESQNVDGERTIYEPDVVWKYGIDHDLFVTMEKKWVFNEVKVLAKRTYKDRFKEAQFWAYSQIFKYDVVGKARGKDVWDFGYANNLFLESEMEKVIGDRDEAIREKEEQKTREIRRKFESEQYQAHIARGEMLSSPAPFLQGFAFAAIAPELAIGAELIQTKALSDYTHEACTKGTGDECRDALISVGMGIVTTGVQIGQMRGGPREIDVTGGVPQGARRLGSGGGVGERFDVSATKTHPQSGYKFRILTDKMTGVQYGDVYDPSKEAGILVNLSTKEVIGKYVGGKFYKTTSSSPTSAAESTGSPTSPTPAITAPTPAPPGPSTVTPTEGEPGGRILISNRSRTGIPDTEAETGKGAPKARIDVEQAAKGKAPPKTAIGKEAPPEVQTEAIMSPKGVVTVTTSSGEPIAYASVTEGELELAMYPKAEGFKVSGRTIFRQILNKFRIAKTKINRIVGNWSPDKHNPPRDKRSWKTNFESFTDAIREGKSDEEAAMSTFTGKMAIENGYTKVTKVKYTKNPDGSINENEKVEAVFE